jgi:hypothetical protein
MHTQKQIDDFKLDQRVHALIRAANGMTTEEAVEAIKIHKSLPVTGEILTTVSKCELSQEEAVRYIEHGRKITSFIRACGFLNDPMVARDAQNLLAKLEGKG